MATFHPYDAFFGVITTAAGTKIVDRGLEDPAAKPVLVAEFSLDMVYYRAINDDTGWRLVTNVNDDLPQLDVLADQTVRKFQHKLFSGQDKLAVHRWLVAKMAHEIQAETDNDIIRSLLCEGNHEIAVDRYPNLEDDEYRLNITVDFGKSTRSVSKTWTKQQIQEMIPECYK